MTFHYIIDFQSVDKACKYLNKKWIPKNINKNCLEVEDPASIIRFKNMYRCTDGDTWDYAEAGYSKCL